MFTIDIYFHSDKNVALPEKVNIKLGDPIKVTDLVQMLLVLHPSLSALLPTRRTEESLADFLDVQLNGNKIPLSATVSDDHGETQLTLIIKDVKGEDVVYGPLHGIKVVELARFISGPYCGLMLADLGADVIKVEKPIGEESRHFAPFHNEHSLYAAALNRNKRAITLDFRHPKAKDVLTRLIRWADIVIENFRPGTMEKMGFGPDRIHDINPGAILVRCSGFGQSGPLKHRPGVDAIGQAMGGLMSLTGTEDTPPTVAGAFIADYTTGMNAAIGALAALHNRNKTGKGQVVDVSLYESVVSMLVSAIPDSYLHGRVPARTGNRDRFAAPSDIYPTKDDRWIYIAAANDGLWERLCKLMGREELLDDPRLKTVTDRVNRVEEIDAAVQQWTKKLTSAELIAALDEAGVPAAPIQDVNDLVNDPHLRERGQIVQTQLPDGTDIAVSGVTTKLSETPGSIRRGVPAIGQHNEEVYTHELGFSKEEWNGLKQEGVC